MIRSLLNCSCNAVSQVDLVLDQVNFPGRCVARTPSKKPNFMCYVSCELRSGFLGQWLSSLSDLLDRSRGTWRAAFQIAVGSESPKVLKGSISVQAL